MKILFITNGINGSGGLERVLSIKASYMAEIYGYEVSILCLNNNHLNLFYAFSDKINMFSIGVSGNPLKYIISYYRGIRGIVDQLEPDIISVCDDGLKGFFVPRILADNTPVIYERHVSKLIEIRRSFSLLRKLSIRTKWKLMEFLAKDFQKFILLTNGSKNEWKSLTNIQVISNPLSLNPIEKASLNNKKVICVGKISYQKGQDLLVIAWRKVMEKFPDWTLELYGIPDENILSQSRLPSTIKLFPPEKHIESKYLESSIYVMASRYEGFGMVLIEAMACGVPCVSFDCNYGPSDIIMNQEDGLLVENGNVEKLANSIIELIDNEQIRKKFGISAKKNVQRFFPEIILRDWNELFQLLIRN